MCAAFEEADHASAKTLPLRLPMYTTPLETAADASPIAKPVANGGLTFAPVVALSARTTPSSAATYTTPFATAGDDRTCPPVVTFQTTTPSTARSAYTVV